GRRRPLPLRVRCLLPLGGPTFEFAGRQPGDNPLSEYVILSASFAHAEPPLADFTPQAGQPEAEGAAEAVGVEDGPRVEREQDAGRGGGRGRGGLSARASARHGRRPPSAGRRWGARPGAGGAGGAAR